MNDEHLEKEGREEQREGGTEGGREGRREGGKERGRKLNMYVYMYQILLTHKITVPGPLGRAHEKSQEPIREKHLHLLIM